MKTLLIFATPLEAEATLLMSEAKQLEPNFWQAELFDILICGIGALNAATQLQNRLHLKSHQTASHVGQNYQRLINLGCAGYLKGDKEQVQQGDLFLISHCSKALEQRKASAHSKAFFSSTFPTFEMPLLADFNHARLVSADCPIHNQEMREPLATSADLVDMEGYALAWVAKQREIPLYLIKAISDFAAEDGPSRIRASLSEISSILSHQVLDQLK